MKFIESINLHIWKCTIYINLRLTWLLITLWHKLQFISNTKGRHARKILVESVITGQIFKSIPRLKTAAAWLNQQNDVRPAKTQISLPISAVWSVYAVHSTGS